MSGTGGTRRVPVIGAGLGGLAAAIHLAAEGVLVDVYERNAAPGGKASELLVDGFRFDTGPSLLTMPFVLDTLFAKAGRVRAEFLDILPVDPICRYTFGDGSTLDAWSDEQRFIEAVRSFAPDDADAVPRFLDHCERIYDLTAELFLFSRLNDSKALLRRSNVRTLLRIHQIDPFRSVHRAVSSFFSDPRLVQLFDRYATYNGSDPWKAPATLNIISHVEYRMGGYYVRGGMYALVTALWKLAEDLGVRFHFGADVQRILVRHGRVSGVQVNGETLDADTVISNADAVHTMTQLLEDAPQRSRYERLEPSCSGFVFLWGVDGLHPELAQHNIFFSEDYRREFREIFDLGRQPSDPTVYVSITSKADPSHAPEGMENWFVLVNMPALRDGAADTNIEGLREAVLARLDHAGLDVRRRIRVERIISPRDLEQRYNSNRGSIYGISSNSPRAAFLRPANKVSRVPGLYLCGGAAHPGGGVPLVLLSGMHAANAVLNR